jgi:hypothetical protein
MAWRHAAAPRVHLGAVCLTALLVLPGCGLLAPAPPPEPFPALLAEAGVECVVAGGS